MMSWTQPLDKHYGARRGLLHLSGTLLLLLFPLHCLETDQQGDKTAPLSHTSTLPGEFVASPSCCHFSVFDEGTPIQPTFFLSHTVYKVIISITVGNCFHYEDKQFLKLLQMINESFMEMSTIWAQLYDMYSGIMQYLPGRYNRIYHLVEELKDFIADRIKDKSNPCTEFNLKNLVHTTLDLFFGGTKSMNSTLYYGFLWLMKHLEVESKIHEEIDQMVGPHQVPSVDDWVNMPYTEVVIHEIQRVIKTVPLGVPPQCHPGHSFPRLPSTQDAFYPQHFLNEKGQFNKNEAFVPFSSDAEVQRVVGPECSPHLHYPVQV
ncbi:hypothetical protein HPG69_018066 [Diceros bicornis minor]|uniref:Cytochrome P450 n=1 Tax=Diceros bicornis minor TaxID=77932 RepID=A0A7J7F7S8_DICBM|nr:hypothetical protein HPG69_018066 [Diceros bicornis minor]